MNKFIFAAIFFFVTGITNFSSAAEIDRAYYLGNPDVSYPLIIAKNDVATSKINGVIRAKVKEIIDTTSTTMAEGNFNSVVLNVDYQIPCNHAGGVLSVILTAYVNYERSAHPSAFCYGLNFNSATGERIFSSNLNYTPEIVTQKLRNYAAKNGIYLFEDFQELNEVPQYFYYDDNMHVHFLFQQYEVAPYAVGIIDLDAAKD